MQLLGQSEYLTIWKRFSPCLEDFSLESVLPTQDMAMECGRQGDGEESAQDDCVGCSPVSQVEAKISIV